MTKSLELIFLLSNEKTVTLTITNPKSNLTDNEINAAMNAIVSSNYFEREGETIIGKKQARFVERTVTDVVMA